MSREHDGNQRRALGKGLSALLPSKPIVIRPPEAQAVQQSPEPAHAKTVLPESFEDFQSIPLDQIKQNADQPRNIFSDEKLMELAQSLKANGLLQPITVERHADGYRLIAGERRWRAAKLAGWTEIPALVRSVEHGQRLELALIENIQREDLNALEIATAFQRLATQHGLSHEQIAERTGKDRSTVTNFLRLLKLGEFARNQLKAGLLSVGHARALLNITDEQEQDALCASIVNQQLSVREVESLVKKLAQQKAAPILESRGEEKEQMDPNVRAALDDMARALGTRVKLVAKSATSGKIEIEYYSQEDLDRVYSVIVKQ